MPETDEKETLHRYLDNARSALLWKLEGLSEYDARRPMTPTGTSLLGLVKHVAAVESWYFGTAFGRAFPGQDELDWDEESQAEMHATAGESPEQIADFYRRVCAHSDATIEALSLDDRGLVPWWPQERRNPTLRDLLIHEIAETARHAGHADILRESIDGAVGTRPDNPNVGSWDAGQWQAYRDKLEQIARDATQSGLPGQLGLPGRHLVVGGHELEDRAVRVGGARQASVGRVDGSLKHRSTQFGDLGDRRVGVVDPDINPPAQAIGRHPLRVHDAC